MKSFAFLFILLPFCVTAQPGNSSKDSSIALPKVLWNKTLNRAFLSVLGAKSDNTSLGNYATMDPVAGAFGFKGSVAIGKDNGARISYLALTINGDLISNSYAALFTDKKLNTNASIQGEWHIRLGQNRFIADGADIGQYVHDMAIQKQKMTNGISKNIESEFESQQNLQLSGYQKSNITYTLQQERLKQAAIQWKVDSLFSVFTTATQQDKSFWTDSLTKISSKIDKLKADSTVIQYRHDSLAIVVSNWTYFSFALDKKVDAEYKSKTTALDTILYTAIKKVRFNWFTVIAGTGRKNYYTFKDYHPFASQIEKLPLTTWKLGVAWNFYDHSRLTNQAFYMNINAIRSEDNNTALLSTQDITQERTIKNSLGDSVRKVAQKYAVYTDSIITLKEWSLSSNFYFLFGKRTSGVHAFSTIHMPDHDKGYFNGGLGYVVSFINNKKDQPVINAEGYIQFNDVFNRLKIPGRFWNRNEIGVRFTLPFSLPGK